MGDISKIETAEEKAINYASIIKRIVSSRSEKIIMAAKFPKSFQKNNQPIEAITEVSISQMECKSRKREYVIVRYVAISIIKELVAMSLKGIGDQFSNRDHSTILHAIGSIEEIKHTTRGFERYFEEIVGECRIEIKR